MLALPKKWNTKVSYLKKNSKTLKKIYKKKNEKNFNYWWRVCGCSSAEIISKIPNTKITIIEKGKYLGAGVRTFFNGGHPFTFGPRHFLTQNK